MIDGDPSDDGGADDDILVVLSCVLVFFEYSKLVDANAADPSNGPNNSIHFH